MPTIAGRQRPIEKFAEAVAKCGPEVSRLFFHGLFRPVAKSNITWAISP